MTNEMYQVTQETLELTKGILNDNDIDVVKAITSDTLYGINLESPAKQIVPFLSPMVNRTPRKSLEGNGNAGKAINYEIIKGIEVAGTATAKEGERGGKMSYDSELVTVPLKKISLQDEVTFESEAANKGFTDVLAVSTSNLILQHKVEEEKIFVGGTVKSIGTPSAPAAKTLTEGRIPAGNYDVYVVALTIPGCARLPREKQFAGLKLNVLNGCTKPSPKTVVKDVPEGSRLELSVPSMDRAFAYAYFVGKSGTAATLQIVSAFPSGIILDKIVEGRTAITDVTADTSGDPLAYEGITEYIYNHGGMVYDMKMDQFTQKGGGVEELDEINALLWNQYLLSPTRYLCGQAVGRSITDCIIEGSGAPLLLVNNNEKANITGNYVVKQYINKSANGQPLIVEIHPYLPDSTMIALTETLPYTNSNVGSVFEVGTGYDYRMTPYARTKDSFEYGIAMWGALKCYMPAAQVLVTNIKPGVRNSNGRGR